MAAFEKQIQGTITRWLTSEGIWWTKIHQQGRGRKGIPDILCCYDGHFIAIEVKTHGGVVSQDQSRELAGITASGGNAVVAYHLDDVKRALSRIDMGHQCTWEHHVDVVAIEDD